MFHHEKTDEHFKQVCLKTNIACMSCNKFMTRGELNEHKSYKNPNICELMIDNCPYSCDFEKKSVKKPSKCLRK